MRLTSTGNLLRKVLKTMFWNIALPASKVIGAFSGAMNIQL